MNYNLHPKFIITSIYHLFGVFRSHIRYQGESNANAGKRYECEEPALIADWRVKFNLPELPFYFVVLAPCSGHKWCADFVNIRNAQLSGGLALNHTGYAVAVDLGDRTSPARSVHTRRKEEVGRRLALVARKNIYGQSVVASGPVFKSVAASGGKLKITYVTGTAETLHVSHTADSNCSGAISKGVPVDSPFEVLSKTGVWLQANYTIDGSNILVDCPFGVPASSTTAIRYGWVQWAQCAIYNGAGGPDDHVSFVSYQSLLLIFLELS